MPQDRTPGYETLGDARIYYSLALVRVCGILGASHYEINNCSFFIIVLTVRVCVRVYVCQIIMLCQSQRMTQDEPAHCETLDLGLDLDDCLIVRHLGLVPCQEDCLKMRQSGLDEYQEEPSHSETVLGLGLDCLP